MAAQNGKQKGAALRRCAAPNSICSGASLAHLRSDALRRGPCIILKHLKRAVSADLRHLDQVSPISSIRDTASRRRSWNRSPSIPARSRQATHARLQRTAPHPVQYPFAVSRHRGQHFDSPTGRAPVSMASRIAARKCLLRLRSLLAKMRSSSPACKRRVRAAGILGRLLAVGNVHAFLFTRPVDGRI